jgi:hypothetical protein
MPSATPTKALVNRISQLLGLPDATLIVTEARLLYEDRLTTRFSEIKVRERIKRTNPFLLRIRGITTVQAWAEQQLRGALLASEEEAVGHLLEAIAKTCHPGASKPQFPDDFDYEVIADDGSVDAYQVKLSWDCMPMSTRKNLSNTVRKLEKQYATEGKQFVGYFAPCYGKAGTTSPKGQAYVSLGSHEFWTKVGGGDPHFDVKVGEAVELICGGFRRRLETDLIPKLVEGLAAAAQPIIGTSDGSLDIAKLFRAVNKLRATSPDTEQLTL